MPKLVKAEHLAEMHRLFAQGRSIDAVFKALGGPEGRGPARGTVANHRNKWLALHGEASGQDVEVDWERLAEYGLPAEARGPLLAVWADGGGRLPTVRQVRHWWALVSSVLEMPARLVLFFGAEMANREILRELRPADCPADNNDVWAFVAYRAWTLNGAQRYMDAVQRGGAPDFQMLTLGQGGPLEPGFQQFVNDMVAGHTPDEIRAALHQNGAIQAVGFVAKLYGELTEAYAQAADEWAKAHPHKKPEDHYEEWVPLALESRLPGIGAFMERQWEEVTPDGSRNRSREGGRKRERRGGGGKPTQRKP